CYTLSLNRHLDEFQKCGCLHVEERKCCHACLLLPLPAKSLELKQAKRKTRSSIRHMTGGQSFHQQLSPCWSHDQTRTVCRQRWLCQTAQTYLALEGTSLPFQQMN